MDNSWKELIGDFLEEAYSLLEALEISLITLEKNPQDKNSIDTVFRVAHTIKGGAGAVGFTNITRLTHIMEDVLDFVRQGKYTLTDDNISLLLTVRDELEALLNAYEHEREHPSNKADELIRELEKLKKIALDPSYTPNTSPNASVNNSNTPSSSDNTLSDYAIDHLPLVARFALTFDMLASLQEALSFDEPIVFIEIRLNEDYELKEVGPFEVLNLINGVAEPIIMNPSPESLDEEYIPFLNVVISSSETPEYLQNKLSLTDVVTSVKVTPLTHDLYVELEQTMNGTAPAIINIDLANNDDDDIFDTTTSEVPQPPTTDNTPSESTTEETANEQSTTNNELQTKQEEKRSPTLKVESSRIDDLLNLLGELVIIRSGLSQFGTDLEKSIYNTRLNLRSFITSNELIPLHNDPELNKERNEQFREDFSVINTSIDHYIEYIQQLTRISSTLQSRMMNLRMVPIQTVFSRFTRLTRDIAKQLDKKIELIMEGGETEIDKSMIDDLYDPLMHMIRNSLDHGIELPEHRLQNGKDAVGTIRLKAYQEGDSIFIEISDDGKGIDADVIAKKAFDKGFVTENQLLNMSQQEKVSLIFLPGFSTADQISNLSGRGVGMDVVNKNIQELGGSASIISEVGKGSTIRIQLPLTLAIIQGLLILIENVHYVIPITSVEETIILHKDILHKLDNYYAIKFREKLIPLISLPKLLYNINSFTENNSPKESVECTFEEELQHQYCIIARFGNRQVGIIIPEILKEQDIVVKPLDNRLISSPGISAATIVGNGEIGFILDISQIVRYYLKNQQ